MSLGVQLEDDRKCSATVVGLDLLSGLSKRDVVHQTGLSNVFLFPLLESFRFEDKDEDEDEGEAFCFRHNEIFNLFRLQLGRHDEGDCNNIVTPSLSRI